METEVSILLSPREPLVNSYHVPNALFFGGKRIARIDPGATTPKYYVSDNLGSTALVTDYLGNTLAESEYYPYGVEQQVLTGDTNDYKFTGKERDSESGNDYFGARYYASTLGRFLSPDWDAKPTAVPYASFGDPQTLNLYSYVENAPLNRVDAIGHEAVATPESPPPLNLAASDNPLYYSWAAYAGTEEYVDAVHGESEYLAQAEAGQASQGTAQAQQQIGQDPTLPTEVQPPPPSLLDGALTATMPKTPLDMALMVGTEGLGELGGAAMRVLELAGEAGKTADYATIAVTETKEGVSIVSSSEARGLRPAVQAALKPGEVAVKGVGHAETTGISAAKQMGLTPTGVAASRGICQGCWNVIKAAGAAALTALKNGVVP